MQYKVTFSDDAEDDIFLAYFWYEQQKKGLGNEFQSALKDSILSIQSNPLLYSYRVDDVRGCNVKRFPYLILYFIDGVTIHVISVLHTSRKPNI